MVYGSALHAAIEALYAPPSDGESMSSTHRLDEALEAYDDVWATSEFCISSQIPYPEGVRDIRDSGEDEVRNFFDRYSSSESPATSDPTPIDRIMHLDATGWKRQPEKRFEVWIGDEGSTRVKLRGVWDMLCEPVEQEPAHSERDEDVDRAQRRLRKRTGQQKLVGKKSPSSTPPPTIIEFKSTLRADRQRPRNWHAPHMLQLQVYAVAHRAWLKERTGDASTVEVRLALKSVESSEEHVATFSEEDLDKVESSLVETYLQMQSSGFHATPSYQVRASACVCLKSPRISCKRPAQQRSLTLHAFARPAPFVHTNTFVPKLTSVPLVTKEGQLTANAKTPPRLGAERSEKRTGYHVNK